MNPTTKANTKTNKSPRAVHVRVRLNFIGLATLGCYHSVVIKGDISFSRGSDSRMTWPLLACAPDQHPDERQFARLQNRRILANDARIGRQKEEGSRSNHIA